MSDTTYLKHGVIAAKGFADDKRGKELAQKASEKSHKSRRINKAAKDVLLDILHSNSTDKDLSVLAQSKGIEPTELATLLLNMTRRAGKSAQMAELVFRLTGDLEQTPQQNITIVNQLTDEQLLNQIQELRGRDNIIDITPKPPEVEG
jgi:hypothetical protein